MGSTVRGRVGGVHCEGEGGWVGSTVRGRVGGVHCEGEGGWGPL